VLRLRDALDTVAEADGAGFPAYVTEQDFQNKFVDTMLTWNAYQGEIEYFKIFNPDYVALGPNSLGIDSAYFWSDAVGKLNAGVVDWGGFGILNLGHKIYGTLKCADFEHLKSNLDDYIAAFIGACREHGGPKLEAGLLRQHVLLAALASLAQAIQAIPACLRICDVEEWATVTKGQQPGDADSAEGSGSGTLRSTLRQLDNGLRIIGELQVDRVLADWVQDVWVGKFRQKPKTEAMIRTALA